MSDFKTLGVTDDQIKKLASQDITEPTPIQEAAIQALLDGRDALMQAPTGTGKTLAYLLPAIAKLEAGRPGMQVLVLAPSHELALQIKEVARLLLEGTAFKAMAVLGGVSMTRQKDQLKKGPSIIIGTPGRVRDVAQKGWLNTPALTFLVLDEFDQLDKDPHRADVKSLLRDLPAKAQRVFCSATLEPQSAIWARGHLRNPLEALLGNDAAISFPPNLQHVAFVIERRDKISLLRRLIRHYDPAGAVAFVNRTGDILTLVEKLSHHQMSVAGIHGSLDKLERARIMREFRQGKIQLLISTELAARGLDWGQVGLVFNYDLPTDAGHYAHRAGRTARMGRDGIAISFADPKEAFVLKKLEKSLGIAFDYPVYQGGEVRFKKPEEAPSAKPEPAQPGLA